MTPPQCFRQLTHGPYTGQWVLATSAHGHNLPSNITHTLILEEYRALVQAGHTVLIHDGDTAQTAEKITRYLAQLSQ